MNRWNKERQEALAEQLQKYGQSDYYPLHMPGHKRRLYGQLPWEFVKMDITEIEGFDNLHQPEGILKKMQEHAASLYGAEESFYLVNGSTCGILSAISAAVPEGGHILMARNCHKSAYHACYLRNLTVSYLYPEIKEECDICEAVTAWQVEEALESLFSQGESVDAVLIVSPTYEGRIADVEKIAAAVHKYGIILIVDEAHGAHLGFDSALSDNSCRRGADLVIHSVHKTLPAPTQTALLHVNGFLVDRERLRRFLHIYQSSSPSYILMAGIENALAQIEAQGKELFGDFIRNWEEMCTRLSSMRHFRILFPDRRQDPGKLVVSVKKTGLSGQQLYDMLLKEYHLQLEMATSTYVLAMFTIGDSKEGFDRLTEALEEMDESLSNESAERSKVDFADNLLQLERRVPLKEAWDGEKQWCPLSECEGRVVSEFVNLYPPGVPMAVPGELINDALIRWIKDCLENGLNVQGIKQYDATTYLSVIR